LRGGWSVGRVITTDRRRFDLIEQLRNRFQPVAFVVAVRDRVDAIERLAQPAELRENVRLSAEASAEERLVLVVVDRHAVFSERVAPLRS